MPFVITDFKGNYVHVTDKAVLEIVNDISKATRFKYNSANNFINKSMNETDRKHGWTIIDPDYDDDTNIDLDEIKIMQEEIYRKLSSHINKLNNEYAVVDNEIIDIQHYIEFFDFNAAQGYNAYKMLQESLRKRRKIKDDRYKTTMLLNATSADYVNDVVDKQFKGLDGRQYTPRVLKELFETNY